MNVITCPGCGKPARFRVPRHLVREYKGVRTYLCLPDGSDVAFAHEVPAEQALSVAYPMEAPP